MHIFSKMAPSSHVEEAEEEEDSLLDLFDSHWFHHAIFKGSSTARLVASGSGPKLSNEPGLEKAELSRVNTLQVRSMSDRFLEVEAVLTDTESVAASPKSVLAAPKLQTIVSGKEGAEEQTEDVPAAAKRLIERRRRRWKKKKSSKSMTELEFEEVKGFMDLGFVFSDEDKASADLVSIIPGLVGRNRSGGEEGSRRPYLSEAWGKRETERRRKAADPLGKWKVPNLGDERAAKDQLRLWAHAVASAVR